MHKLTIILLRTWITCTSLGAFLFGWVVFAHAPKPAPLGAANLPQPPAQSPADGLAPLPTLAPLPAPGQPVARLQPLPSRPAQPGGFFSLPRLRTRGS